MRIFTLLSVVSAVLWSTTADATKYTFDHTGSSVTFHNTASLHGIDGAAKKFSSSFDSDSGTGSIVVQRLTLSISSRIATICR